MKPDLSAKMSNVKRWHVVYTSINAEACAQAEIGKLGFPVFVPFEKRLRRLPGRKPYEYQTAYFPRYGFVRFDLDQNTWPRILGAKGVLELLRNNGIPVAVADNCIAALQLADRVGLFDKTKPPSVGMFVEITAGPFCGFFGKILRARTADRMDVLLEMFGGITATVPLAALRENAK